MSKLEIGTAHQYNRKFLIKSISELIKPYPKRKS